MKWIDQESPELILSENIDCGFQKFKLITENMVVYGKFYKNLNIEIFKAQKLFLNFIPYKTQNIHRSFWTYGNENERVLVLKLNAMRQPKLNNNKKQESNLFG